MTDAEFEKILGKGGLAGIFTGLGLFLFGIGIIALMVSGADPDSGKLAARAIHYPLAALSLFFGGLVVFQQIRTALSLRAGGHPLVRAIAEGDRDFVYRYHVQEFRFRAQASGDLPKVRGGTNYQVWMYGRDGKKYIINNGNRAEGIDRILAYLAEKFPGARRTDRAEESPLLNDG